MYIDMGASENFLQSFIAPIFFSCSKLTRIIQMHQSYCVICTEKCITSASKISVWYLREDNKIGLPAGLW